MSDTPAKQFQFPEGLITAPLQDIFKALDNNCRLVGGPVRDAILGEVATDIDICTPYLPEETTSKLKAAGFGVVPTGLEHGTVTAVHADSDFKAEITTLRKDVSTDGRRATVEFSESYRDDAMRRDLTFNALSADLEGNIWDYTDGLADLEAGKVRFIGDAKERLKEDWLRALRFIRFYARFAREEVDAETTAALTFAADSMDKLSRERKTEEVFKLLMQDTWEDGLTLLEDTGLAKALDLPFGIESHNRLNWYLSFCPDAPAEERFFALTFDLPDAILENEHFNLSNNFKKLVGTCPRSEVDFFRISESEILTALIGKDIVKKWLALRFGAWETTAEQSTFIEDFIAGMDDLHIPEFPLTGHDMIESGLTGPEIGLRLAQVKSWWAVEKYPSKDACLERLKHLLSHNHEHHDCCSSENCSHK
ncbi:MAG: hypothetical protein VX730_02095 [Pseudomonadota bacterium]|nr:hypothetical protein [Pseudomonadota bacterium]